MDKPASECVSSVYQNKYFDHTITPKPLSATCVREVTKPLSTEAPSQPATLTTPTRSNPLHTLGIRYMPARGMNGLAMIPPNALVLPPPASSPSAIVQLPPPSSPPPAPRVRTSYHLRIKQALLRFGLRLLPAPPPGWVPPGPKPPPPPPPQAMQVTVLVAMPSPRRPSTADTKDGLPKERATHSVYEEELDEYEVGVTEVPWRYGEVGQAPAEKNEL